MNTQETLQSARDILKAQLDTEMTSMERSEYLKAIDRINAELSKLS